MCHLANLLMGIGLLQHRPTLVGMSVLWSLLGAPLWIRELFLEPCRPSSYLAHVVGLGVSLWALPGYRRSPSVWRQALALGVAVRALCWWVTPAALNVNVSHAMRDGWEQVFSAFWQYWLASTLAMGALLYVVDRVVRLGERHDRGSGKDPAP